MTDFYYYSNDNYESMYAVNYGVEARYWFITNGFKLNYVTSREMILLHKIPVIENKGKLID